MMKRVIITIFICVSSLMMTGCHINDRVIFDTPFVWFDTASSSTLTVDATGDFTGTYYVHYSGASLSSALVVDFSIAANGLVEGVDYEMVTSGNQLNFMPGIFELPIRIHWMKHELNPQQTYSLTLRLESANQDVVLGMPGPDQLSRQIVINTFMLN